MEHSHSPSSAHTSLPKNRLCPQDLMRILRILSQRTRAKVIRRREETKTKGRRNCAPSARNPVTLSISVSRNTENSHPQAGSSIIKRNSQAQSSMISRAKRRKKTRRQRRRRAVDQPILLPLQSSISLLSETPSPMLASKPKTNTYPQTR
jgi:hypothetical protein